MRKIALRYFCCTVRIARIVTLYSRPDRFFFTILFNRGDRKAGPDGGNGGSGGSVVLEADNSVKQLRHINKHLKAENGEPGRTSNCHGRNGRHLIVKVHH